MSYGIQLINKYNTIVIDETHQNFLTTASNFTTVSANVTYPPTGVVNTRDLIFAAPAVSQSKTVGYTETFKWNNTTNAATSYRYIVFKRADLLTAATSGYGIQVFDSGSDLCFESGREVGFRVVATVPITGRNLEVTLPTQATTYSNFQNYAVLVNANVIGSVFEVLVTWEWVTSTTGRINVASTYSFGYPKNILIVEILK